MPALPLTFPPPPTADFAGSNSERQSVGLPGHCEPCAQHGHVKAHPDLGCGDVGCNRFHEEPSPADGSARRAALSLTFPPPPTADFAGSNSERQSVGLPGHCESCAQHGHVKAHPDLGCGDVGCNRSHH